MTELETVVKLLEPYEVTCVPYNHGYRLKSKTAGWIKDVYPTTQRVYTPNAKNQGPFIKDFPEPHWTLLQVVKGLIKELKA